MLEQDLERAAQELAHSDAVEEILSRIEGHYTNSWKNSPPEKPEQREQFYRMVLAIDALRNEIKSLAQSEKISSYNRRLAADTRKR